MSFDPAQLIEDLSGDWKTAVLPRLQRARAEADQEIAAVKQAASQDVAKLVAAAKADSDNAIAVVKNQAQTDVAAAKAEADKVIASAKTDAHGHPDQAAAGRRCCDSGRPGRLHVSGQERGPRGAGRRAERPAGLFQPPAGSPGRLGSLTHAPTGRRRMAFIGPDSGGTWPTPVSVLYLSKFNVLKDVTVLKTSAWNVGQGYQQNMVQMASVPWISTYPS